MHKRKRVRSPSPSSTPEEFTKNQQLRWNTSLSTSTTSKVKVSASEPKPQPTATDEHKPGNTKLIKLKLHQCDRKWKHFQRENLSLDYTILYDCKKASELIAQCESELVYNVGHLAQVRMFGKWIDIPRKQVAFGDPGLTYTFSGNTVPAIPWTPLLHEMKNDISKLSGYEFNFVLVNRYQDGNDYMGEHKDDEKDLCPDHPIASLSLGQSRDFVFRHQDSRGKNAKRNIDKLTIQLENGSLLMMNAPTNSYWYHCLPKRPRILGTRLNFTFRKMVPSLCQQLKNTDKS